MLVDGISKEILMRKKSHISLAKGVIHGLDINSRINHRLSFYVGSIWPDCTPSFLTRRHCIEETFDIFLKRMSKFIIKFNPKRDMGIISTWRMGVVLHYIADYFTFPHNSNYTGSLKEHCAYEEELKHRMYQYIDAVKASEAEYNIPVMTNTKQIAEYIREKHDQYMSIEGNVDADCGYSYLACIRVMASLMSIAASKSVPVMVAA